MIIMFSDFPIIDIHVHCQPIPGFPRNFKGDTYPTPEQLIKQYDQLGIAKGVVLPLVSPEGRRIIQSNELLIYACKEHPNRLVPFCNIDPRMISNSPDAPLAHLLMYYVDKGCKGVGEVTANLPFTNPLVQNMFAACQLVNMPVIFHIAASIGGMYGLYDEPRLPLLEETLKSFPDVTFLGHSQAFWSEIGQIKDESIRGRYPTGPIEKEGRVVELMKAYPNLHGDLSAKSGYNAISRDKEFGLRFMKNFQDRLYFGTDICVASQKTPLLSYFQEIYDDGIIAEAILEKILFKNAEEILKNSAEN
ncbi:MAG: amidohydrolase family protein [Candidatus Lokiarchaeota archaeon]|nr:amidohydrolase family protein [Candidatus Lokiarchaeota archaeon]